MDANLPTRLLGYLPVLAHGALTTLWVALLAIVIGFVLGAALLGLSSRRPPGRGLARALHVLTHAAVALYVSFFRGTPLLVQLLMLFYLPSAAGLDLPPTLAALIALGLNSAAFQCEILRAGLAAVPAGQVEAAQVCGFTGRQIFRHIQLPQIATAVWPAVVSEAIDVMKGSAIVSVIAVTELTRAGRQLVASTYRPLEVYSTVALMYLVMSALIVLLGMWVRRRLGPNAAAGRDAPPPATMWTLGARA